MLNTDAQINNDLEAKRQEMETMNNEHSELQEQIEQKKREKAKFDKDAVATEKKKSSLEQQKSNQVRSPFLMIVAWDHTILKQSMPPSRWQDREAFRLREQLEKKRKRATQQENEVESKRKEKEEQQERIQQLEEDLENLDYGMTRRAMVFFPEYLIFTDCCVFLQLTSSSKREKRKSRSKLASI